MKAIYDWEMVKNILFKKFVMDLDNGEEGCKISVEQLLNCLLRGEYND